MLASWMDLTRSDSHRSGSCRGEVVPSNVSRGCRPLDDDAHRDRPNLPVSASSLLIHAPSKDAYGWTTHQGPRVRLPRRPTTLAHRRPGFTLALAPLSRSSALFEGLVAPREAHRQLAFGRRPRFGRLPPPAPPASRRPVLAFAPAGHKSARYSIAAFTCPSSLPLRHPAAAAHRLEVVGKQTSRCSSTRLAVSSACLLRGC